MGSLGSDFSAKQALQKYEDFVVADRARPFRPYAVYALLDGHNGDSVSHFLSCHLLPELAARLPDAPAPGHDQLDALHAYAELVRKAVTAAFLALSLRVQQLGLAAGGSDAGDGGSGSGSGSGSVYSSSTGAAGSGSCGSTATVAVQAGPLLTVANVGNSRAVLDVGHTSFELTADHKVGNNEDEDERLDAAGARVARLKFDLSGPAGAGEVGCGPLRLWPGGLHMSRAIGDDGCSSAIIPHPSICQVVLPARASRLIVATGSVWDAFETFQKAAGLLRDVSLANAAPALLRRAQQRKQHRQVDGDASVLVVDFVPEACSGFKSQMRLDRLSRTSTGSQHSASGGAAGAASSLVRRLSNSKLTALGSLAPAQQQQRLQQQVVQPQAPQPQSFYRHSYSGNVSASTPFSAAAPAAAAAAAPRSDAAEQQQQHQQQPQRPPGGLMQQLKAALCMAAPPSRAPGTTAAAAAAAAAGPSPSQLTPQSSGGLQHSSSFGSSSTTDTLSSGAASTASSGGRSWRSRSWSSTSSRRRGAAKAAPQLRQIQEDVTVSRILARVDSFQVYCDRRYGHIGPQLAALDAQLALAGAGVHGRTSGSGSGSEADTAAHAVRAVRSLNDLQLASHGGGGGDGSRMQRRSPAAASASPRSIASMPLSV